MNTNLGYSKKTLTNTDVLLSGGGNKPLTDFIGSISWDATNRKLKYTPVGGSTTDLVTFGSNALNSTSFLSSVHAGLLEYPPNTYKVTYVSAGIAPYISDVGTNIFAGATTTEITVERSHDDGATWTDVTTTEATNIKNVFSGAIYGDLYIPGNLDPIVGDTLRVTFNPTNSTRYSKLAFMYIYVATRGANATCTIEKNKYTELNSWTTYISNAPVAGNTGPNIIGLGDIYFGQGDSRNSGYGLRFTFRINTLNISGSNNGRMSIQSIQGFTSNRAWGTPSGNSIARNNTPYKYLDADRAVQFDSTVKSSGFIKVGSSSSYVLLGNGGHKALSEFVGAVSYDSNSKKLQYMPIGGNATDVVTFGSNAFNSVAYLPLVGGTMTGTEYFNISDAQLSMDENYTIGNFNKDIHILVKSGSGTGINDGYVGSITFGSGNANSYAGIYVQSSGSYGTRMIFGTTNSYAVGSKARMIITHDGKVGIRTMTPSYDLHIVGTLNASSTITLNGTAVSLSGHKHAYTDLTGSGTTADLAIVSNGTANGWTLKTLGSRAFDSTSYLPLSGGTLSGQLVSSLATGTAPINVASNTVCTNLNADLLDGYHESSFFRSNIGEVNTAYIDIEDYTSGAEGFVSLRSGIYRINRDGHTELLAHFHASGSTTALELMTNYPDSSGLFYRKTIDNNRVSGPWRYFITSYNIGALSVNTANKLKTSRTIWGLSFDGSANISGNMSDVGTISASGNIIITKTSKTAVFRATNDNGSIEIRAGTNRGVYDYTTSTWLIGTNGSYTFLNQGNVGIGVDTPTEKLDVNGTILGTSVKAGAFGINNTSKTSGNGISLYNGVTSGAPTNGIMFAGTDTFGTCGGVTYTWSTYFTVSNETNNGWIFKRGSTNVASIDGNGSGYFSSSLTSSAVYTPSLEFKNVASGTGNGGYIDFHYDGASSYTSRIIESASGSIEASCTNFITNGTQFNLLSDESIINMRVPSSTSYVRAMSYRGTTASNADLYVGDDFHDTKLTGRDVYIRAYEATVMCIKHRSNSVGIGTSSPNYKLEVNGDCGATNFIGTSDIRLKNIISYLVPDLDTIAAAPGFLFKWKDQEKGTKTYAGTSALYWYDRFSYVVHKANDLIGTLAIQHDVLGVLCSISIARELKMLKEEVQELKEYVNNHLQ